MGLKLFDQYTYLHFASGIIAYYLGLPMLWWFIAHTVFEITENMKIAAAMAIADSVSDEQLAADYIMPSVFDKSVVERVAPAVAAAAVADGVVRGQGASS